MKMLEDYLRENAQHFPERVAVVCGSQSLTYREIYERVMEHVGDYEKGRIYAFRSFQDVEFLITYFAIHISGAVAAPLERDIPEDKLRQLSDWMWACTPAEGTADILYTTGTTGQAKGVMVSHRAIVADAENLVEAHGYRRQTAFVIAGPLNHIGSLSKIYPVMLTGGTLIILEGMKDMDAFFRVFQLPYAEFATFLVPANIRILVRFCSTRLKEVADRVAFVETGAAPLSQADMEEFCRLLPHTRLYNTYASTETGIIATYEYSKEGPVAGCLGRPMRHSGIEITPQHTIVCRGDTLMSGYLDNPSLTAQVLYEDAVHTSDLGRLDDEGRLHLQGRDDDVINVGGFKVSPAEVEDVALSLPLVKDCICTAVPHPVTGQALQLLVVLHEGGVLNKRELARLLSQRLETHKVPALYQEVNHIERTFNGKLNRKFYRESTGGKA